MASASAKQLRFWQRLLVQSGQTPSDDLLDSFAQLSVQEASARISELQERGFGKKADASPSSQEFEEPE